MTVSSERMDKHVEGGESLAQVTLHITGMTCAHCQSAVTKALSELDGVDQVAVDLDKGTAEVTYDSSKVNREKMKEAVEEQGYDVA